MKQLLKMFASLAACFFLVVPAWAQTIDGADVLTNLHASYKTVKWPTSTFFDSSYRLLPYESASDSTGKTYHYIMPATRAYNHDGDGNAIDDGEAPSKGGYNYPYNGPSRAAYETHAIDVRGYKTASVQIFSSSFGLRTAPAGSIVIMASGAAGTYVSFYGSVYPAAITVSTTMPLANNPFTANNNRDAIVPPTRLLMDNFVQLPLAVNGMHSTQSFDSALNFVRIMSTNGSGTGNGAAGTAMVVGASDINIAGFPRPATMVTQNGISSIDLGGGIANLVLVVSKTIGRTTDHIILRVDR